MGIRRDVSFTSDGVTLRGWLYLPAEQDVPAPAVVMAHGISAVKEMRLPAYAERFAAAGLAVLVFDFRNLGESDGEPRQEIDPRAQVADYRHAISWCADRAEIDAGRIGVWGSSLSGGHALVVAATDDRVRCVVAQVPMVSGSHTVRRLAGQERLGRLRAVARSDVRARARGESPVMLPVVTADPAGLAVSPSPQARRWFTQNAAPRWRNEITARSWQLLTTYEPANVVAGVSPAPLLMLVATQEASADVALATFDRAKQPKRLVRLQCGHFGPYQPPFFYQAVSAATAWFCEHLVEVDND